MANANRKIEQGTKDADGVWVSASIYIFIYFCRQSHSIISRCAHSLSNWQITWDSDGLKTFKKGKGKTIAAIRKIFFTIIQLHLKEI